MVFRMRSVEEGRDGIHSLWLKRNPLGFTVQLPSLRGRCLATIGRMSERSRVRFDSRLSKDERRIGRIHHPRFFSALISVPAEKAPALC